VAKHPYLPDPLRRRVLGTPWLQGMFWALEAYAAMAVWGVLRLLGPDRSVRLMSRLFAWVGPRLAKSRHVRTNLAIMFPEKSSAERASIEGQIWGEQGALFAAYAHMDRICRAEQRRIEVVAPDAIVTRIRKGLPAVFVTAHLSSFHISTWAGTQLGGRATVLYNPDSNPKLDRVIQRRREPIACNLVPRDGGIRVLMRELAQGGCVGLVVDNRADEGELVPFFGRPAPTVTTPARLALHFDCPLVPVRVERLDDEARFRITMYDAVQPSESARTRPERALDMTRQLNEHFERWIRERPGQWLVMSRRWPRGEPDLPAPEASAHVLPSRASEA
jgi:Kdo2-lipid IVA lauroyltransferase/acyltransferase